MAQDWAANVKKYVPDADDGIIAGIVRYCGIALQKRDSSLVSMSDPAETGRVRENFLKKKLALSDSDDILNAAIAEVGERMKGENFKNRVTVYYLLAEKFGMLDIFQKKGAAKKASAGAAAAAAGGAALGIASLGADDDATNPGAPSDATSAVGSAGAAASATVDRLTSGGGNDDDSGVLGWLWWMLLAALAAALIWWLFWWR